MNITIVGGGNVGTQLAVHCAEKNHNVTIYTSEPEIFSNELSIINENDEVIHMGKIKKATNNDEEAFKEADLIFITYPAFSMNKIADKILPFIKEKIKICIVPGTGGGEFSFRKCIEKGAIVFGMQRVPSVARLTKNGKVVRAVGYRDTLYVSAVPNKYSNDCAKLLNEIMDMQVKPLPNYLNITLTPSNQILHTTRLYSIFKDYHEGIVYDRLPLFYEEWTDDSSELLLSCDNEVQKICEELKIFDLSSVKSLKEHYECNTTQLMTNKIRSIKGFKGLPTPSVKTEKGYIPDLNSRYFTADFNYGLIILIQLADMLEINVSSMKKIWNWYSGIADVSNIFKFEEYLINNINDFIDFYKK